MSSVLLPPNRTKLEADLADVIFNQLDEIPVTIRDLWNPDTCPLNLLPSLAWALRVEYWDTAWSETVKRQVIKDGVKLILKKGTPWAVETAIKNATGHTNVNVHEWYEYSGSPYHFTVDVQLNGVTPGQTLVDLTNKMISNYKNARSVLDAVYFYETVQSNTYVGVGIHAGFVFTVKSGDVN